MYLLSVLRVEWASNAGGHGSGSLASTNLQAQPVEAGDPSIGGGSE